MEFKNLQDFHDAFKDAWWMNGESESDSSTDNEGFADILQFKSLIAALRPDYKNDLLHVIDVLVNFHENGCPEDDADSLVMMDFLTFRDTLDNAQRIIVAMKADETAKLLDRLECETDAETTDREMKELADLMNKKELCDDHMLNSGSITR